MADASVLPASPPQLPAFCANVMQAGQKLKGFSSGRRVHAAAALLQTACAAMQRRSDGAAVEAVKTRRPSGPNV